MFVNHYYVSPHLWNLFPNFVQFQPFKKPCLFFSYKLDIRYVKCTWTLVKISWSIICSKHAFVLINIIFDYEQPVFKHKNTFWTPTPSWPKLKTIITRRAFKLVGIIKHCLAKTIKIKKHSVFSTKG